MLEPGQPFKVELREGKIKVECVTPSFRTKRKLLDALQKIEVDSGASDAEKYGALEIGFLLCAPDGDADLDRLSDVEVMEVIGKTVSAGSVSEDERKKSE